MTTTETTTRTALFVPKATRLVAALEIVTVAACLALGVAFVGSLWTAPVAPPPTTAQTCAIGPAAC
jgi:hypothetical protein